MGGYLGKSVGGFTSVTEKRQTFNITTTTTQLTGLSYTPTKEEVHVNGIRYVRDVDYTADDGLTITLTNPLLNGDTAIVRSFPSFDVADTVSASNGGTFAGNVQMSGNATVGGTLGVTGNVSHTGTLTTNNDIIANKHLRLYTTDDQANQWYVYTNTDDSLRFNYNGAGNDEIVINNDGIVTKPSNPWFSAYGTGSGWVSSANYGENILSIFSGGTVYQNSGGGFNSSTSTYTAPVSGRYCFLYNTYTKGGASTKAGEYLYPRLYVNNSPAPPRENICHYNGENYDQGRENTVMLDLAANDAVKCGFWSSNTTNQYYPSSFSLQMFFIG